MANSKEAQFQQDIIDAMAAGGWRVGTASGYDRATALYTEDLLGYVQDAWPERWDKFCKANPQASEQVFVQKMVRELEQAGTLDVLRHGFKVPGVAFDLCSFKPDHAMNPAALSRYQANRLRVVPEAPSVSLVVRLALSPKSNPEGAAWSPCATLFRRT